MPTSHTGQINTIVDIITTINPKSVLDIGIGHGKYGFLSREYLDISSNTEVYNDRKVRIDGIEAFPDYVTDLQRQIYDNIYIGDAEQVISTTGNYDLIMLIDVFEHFHYENGMNLLKKCLEKSRNVLVSCPKHVEHQGAEYGNVFETHRFEWKKHHFKDFPEVAFIPNYYSLIVLLGKDARKIKSTWASQDFKVKLTSRYPLIKSVYRWLKGGK